MRTLKGNKNKHLEPNEYEHTTDQSLWNAAKAVPTGKFITKKNIYNRIKKRSPISHLGSHFKKLENKYQNRSEISKMTE